MQVRNVGTWAGNLSLCWQHPEFQSDMATILTAAGATLSVMDDSGTVVTQTVEAFFASTSYAALVGLTIPKLSGSAVLRTYKVMRRHQNAHAVVNAGFSLSVVATPSVSAARPCNLSTASYWHSYWHSCWQRHRLRSLGVRSPL